VTFNGIVLGTGKGHNKKTAEQKAAQEALDRLTEDPELLNGTSE
jgi:dsRNA-specific ribonuclease